MATNRPQTESKSKVQKPIRPKAKWSEVENALSDVKGAFGFVPSFVDNLVDQGLPGAWDEVKHLRFSTDTSLDIKLKGLIGLAIASQVPCDRIKYFDEKSSLAEGATTQEQHEAVMMAAVTRHWSTVLNGSLLDKAEFRKEADKVMAYAKKMMEDSRENMPKEDMFLVMPKTADETYQDIEQTLGLVPKFFLLFSKEGIAGAWSEFKGLQLNPYTSLNGKQKELIGLAVAAQIPCEYCIYFHRAAAVLNGATDRELQEAISLAAVARHWSTIFHGPHIDPATFRREVDQMIETSSHHQLQ